MKFVIFLATALLPLIPLHAATTQPAAAAFFPAIRGNDQPRRIVFVVDPRSADDWILWQPLAQKIESAVTELVGAQSFDVIVVAAVPHLFAKGPVPASDQSRSELHRWLNDPPKLTGSHDAAKAFEAAFALKPDLIYFATIADLPNDSALMKKIEVLNRDASVRVMTSAAYWGGRKPSESDIHVLERIALENRGDFTPVRIPEPQAGRLGGSIFRTTGRQSDAKRIVFVCDASGSMLNKFATLRGQLFKAMDGLTPDQSFDLVFMTELKCLMLSGQMLPATAENKAKGRTLIEDTVTPRGETNPIPAIDAAFATEPDLIFLLTDGDFPDNNAVSRRIMELNQKHKVAVNTIAFTSQFDTDTDFLKLLQQIARDSHGIYVHVKEEDVGQ